MSCQYCRNVAFTNEPFKVITKMGREIEVTFNHCPVCGDALNRYNPVEKAYHSLVNVVNNNSSTFDDFTMAISEAIGYLGEALE